MSVNIAFYNNKGGVSKTISTANVAAGLMRKGYKVLMIDIDPQGNLSQHFGFDDMEESDSLYDVIFEGRNLLSLIKPLNPNLQIIPSNTSLYALDMELHYVNDKYSEIKNKVCFYLQQNWDFVLMDCPGFLNLLTINAMVASDYLMIPANADLFSLNGIDTLLNLIRDVKKSVATRLTVMGVFLTQIDEDSQISQKAQHILAENLPDLYISQYIRRDSSIAMAPIKGTDVLTYKPESTGAQDYISLVEIILSKIHNKHQVSFA